MIAIVLAILGGLLVAFEKQLANSECLPIIIVGITFIFLVVLLLLVYLQPSGSKRISFQVFQLKIN